MLTEMCGDKVIASAGIRVSVSGRAWDDRMGDRLEFLPTEPYDVAGITGGAMLLRCEVLEDVGGFNESYKMYYEDVDLSFRIRKAGFGLDVVPAAVVAHECGYTTAKVAPLMKVRFCEVNSYRIVADHFPNNLLFRAVFSCLFVGLLTCVYNLSHLRVRCSLATLMGLGAGLPVLFRALASWGSCRRAANDMLDPYIEKRTLYPPRKS